jgi:prepilin-type N-terminal cleavage/methylation domain-containing protein
MCITCPARARLARISAFTLIELLVVIAIIALLVGVLLPALAHARIAGRQAVTLARIRDIGIGCTAYANEFHDQLPALVDREEKAFLGLGVLALHNGVPPQAFVNPNTADTPAMAQTVDGRPVLADLSGAEVAGSTLISSANIASVGWHCSFSFDNDKLLDRAWKPVVYLGDRADYITRTTFSANWKGAGMCVLWTDQHAAFVKSRSLKDQGDPNMYHHNELGGEGASEVREGVSVQPGSLDTHLRFFSEDEDDGLLPN